MAANKNKPRRFEKPLTGPVQASMQATQKALAGPPLDFSFKEIATMQGAHHSSKKQFQVLLAAEHANTLPRLPIQVAALTAAPSKLPPRAVAATDALYEVAESGCPANTPLVHVDPENPDETPTAPPLPRRPNTQLNSIAIRLGNNRLTNLEGLKEFLNHVLDKPDQLCWLDLSCNQLTNVDDILCDFPNLQVCVALGPELATT
jgi:hypothetical protein